MNNIKAMKIAANATFGSYSPQDEITNLIPSISAINLKKNEKLIFSSLLQRQLGYFRIGMR